MIIRRKLRQLNHRRIDAMRALALSLVRWAYDSRSRRLPAGRAEKNILIFRLDDKIGDSITATGFLREVKKQFPDHRLIVLAGPATAAVYGHSQAVDEVMITRKGLWSTLSLYLHLRKQSYRYIINTSHILSARVVFLCSQLRAENKFSFLSDSYRLFSKHVHYDPIHDHVSVRYQRTLENMSQGAWDLSYSYTVSEKSRHLAKTLLAQHKISRFVVLNSFAGSRMRSLNQQTTTAIVRGLLQVDPHLQIVSVGNGNDLPLAKKWQADAGFGEWYVFSAATDFETNAALIEQSLFVITPDTALIHLASALKKPLVGIYRQDAGGNKERNTKIWAPFGTDYRMVLAPNDQSPDPDINLVHPEEVVRAVADLLHL